jgi:redox-sensitive bicupin YhaK (pirin superfamily)
MTTNKRTLVKQYRPAGQPGFLGAGHIARALIEGEFAETDPFILLMDDMLNKKDDLPAGGAHPHAGFETVTLLLEGELGDDTHGMKAGDLEMMTAGSGIIHTETITKKTRLRILQLWLTLSKEERWIAPRIQSLPGDHVSKTSVDGLDIKLYSGSLGGISSPVKNHTPVIISDISVKANVSAKLNLPASYTTFIYVLEGTVLIGEDRKPLGQNEVGWLNRFDAAGESELLISASEAGARFVLYSGEPQGDTIVSHGPFIGDTTEDISRLYREFRAGKMKHISTVADAQKLIW